MINNKSLIQGLKQLKKKRPDPYWAEKNRTELINYFESNFSPRTKGLAFSFPQLKPVVATLLIIGVILVGSWGTVQAAKNSVPGDALYTVKRVAEKTRLAFIFNQSQKNVLRAELLSERLNEVEILAKRAETDIRGESKLIVATQDLHQDIMALKNNIIAQSAFEAGQPTQDVTFDKGSLPIQDGKKIAQVIQSEDLKQILEETQKLLKEENLITALEKTVAAEKELAEPVATSTPVQIEEIQKTINSDSKDSFNIQPIIHPEQILKQSPGSIGSLSASPSGGSNDSDDFGIAPIREEGFSGGLIREK